jgi:predicted nucleic acid-binding protein
MRLYVDANAIIYSIEGLPQFREIAVRWIERAQADGPLITSQLSRLECRVKPLREDNRDVLARFDSFFASPALFIRAVDAVVIDLATEIRATHGFKTPDAIHLATATAEGCDTFLTGDTSLARYPNLDVIMLS